MWSLTLVTSLNFNVALVYHYTKAKNSNGMVSLWIWLHTLHDNGMVSSSWFSSTLWRHDNGMASCSWFSSTHHFEFDSTLWMTLIFMFDLHRQHLFLHWRLFYYREHYYLLVGSWLNRSIRNSIKRSQYRTEASLTPSKSFAISKSLSTSSFGWEKTLQSRTWTWRTKHQKSSAKTIWEEWWTDKTPIKYLKELLE